MTWPTYDFGYLISQNVVFGIIFFFGVYLVLFLLKWQHNVEYYWYILSHVFTRIKRSESHICIIVRWMIDYWYVWRHVFTRIKREKVNPTYIYNCKMNDQVNIKMYQAVKFMLGACSVRRSSFSTRLHNAKVFELKSIEWCFSRAWVSNLTRVYNRNIRFIYILCRTNKWLSWTLAWYLHIQLIIFDYVL